MYNDTYGPIEEFDWGRYKVCGEIHSGKGINKKGKGKDIILLGDKTIEWKERHGHVLNINMVNKLINKDIDVLIIGKGVHGSLQCPVSVKNYLLEHGIEKVEVENTPYACRLYNKYYKMGKRVAMMAHATC